MGDFEKDLQDAFEGVEFTPSEQVWAGVEKGLRPGKKGIFFMWQTYGIAATLLLVLSLGYLFRDELFAGKADEPAKRELSQENGDNGNDTEPTDAQSADDDPQKSGEPEPEEGKDALDVNGASPGIKDLQARNAEADGSVNQAANLAEVAKMDATGTSKDIVARAPQGSIEALKASSQNLTELKAVVPESSQADETMLIDQSFMGPLTLSELKESMAAITNRWNLNNFVEPMEIATQAGSPETALAEARQTSLNGSLGSAVFTPNSSLDMASPVAEDVAIADPRFVGNLTASSTDQSESQLGSISVGFGVGLPIAKRWILKTGLRYSQYRFASTSNAYSLEDGQELPIYTRVAFDNTDVRFAGEYELTNTLHSLSIPAQFGWKSLDKGRFGSWFNIGVAADYFVSYTVMGDLNFLETRQVDFSESNFINRFNINALTGLEFTYQLNEKFALSGEVFLRQYIPMGNGDANYTSAPSVLGFGLGLNYYLKKK